MRGHKVRLGGLLGLLLTGVAVAAPPQELYLRPPAYERGGVALVPARPFLGWLAAELTFDRDDSGRPVLQAALPVAGATRTFRLAFGADSATVNGLTLPLGAPFTQRDQRLMLPLRALATAFALDVDWEPTTHRVVVTSGDRTCAFAVGEFAAPAGTDLRLPPGEWRCEPDLSAPPGTEQVTYTRLADPHEKLGVGSSPPPSDGGEAPSDTAPPYGMLRVPDLLLREFRVRAGEDGAKVLRDEPWVALGLRSGRAVTVSAPAAKGPGFYGVCAGVSHDGWLFFVLYEGRQDDTRTLFERLLRESQFGYGEDPRLQHAGLPALRLRGRGA